MIILPRGITLTEAPFDTGIIYSAGVIYNGMRTYTTLTMHENTPKDMKIELLAGYNTKLACSITFLDTYTRPDWAENIMER
ncbi:hypothetical protein [Pyrococcus kukulkanii]|uniref:hypothetical protein n=1 Tax=Pyrococcus kukulkanii TaxID=1609559 RepID=UPI0035671BF8